MKTGVCVADINNDGLDDIFMLDMLPEDNRQQKLLIAPDNFAKFDLNPKSGFYYRYMQNMLHLNNKKVNETHLIKDIDMLINVFQQAFDPFKSQLSFIDGWLEKYYETFSWFYAIPNSDTV